MTQLALQFETKITTTFLREQLKRYFGYTSFRGNQSKVIKSIMSGKNTVCIMPTGGGKSVCFQLPALLSEGTAIVISPLISLMRDQVESLKLLGIDCVACLNSHQTDKEKQEIYDNIHKIKILYVSPERLKVQSFIQLIKNTRISFLAIDESHCISQYGHDFRPSYLSIPEAFKGMDIPTLALTATATKTVVNDIVKQLNIQNDYDIFVSSFDRPNIEMNVIQMGFDDNDKLKLLLNPKKDMLVKRGSNIIYCNSRKNVDKLYEDLQGQLPNVVKYHAGMRPILRKHAEEFFLTKENATCVATCAFGMGIDKANVRRVVHYTMPQQLEAYYQEIGRAGRDGKQSKSFLIYHPKDSWFYQQFIEIAYPDADLFRDVYELLRYYYNNKKTFLTNIESLMRGAYERYMYVRGFPFDAQIKTIINKFARFGIIETDIETETILNSFDENGEPLFDEDLYEETDELEEGETEIKDLNDMSFGEIERVLKNKRVKKKQKQIQIKKYRLNPDYKDYDWQQRLVNYYDYIYPKKLERMNNLDIMINFSKQNKTCLRKIVLNYFGEEEKEENCGKCSVCLNEIKRS